MLERNVKVETKEEIKEIMEWLDTLLYYDDGMDISTRDQLESIMEKIRSGKTDFSDIRKSVTKR